MINRKVMSMILLAALDFPTNRQSAAKLLQKASQDPDFEDTIEEIHSMAEDGEKDPFAEDVDPLTAGDEDDEDDDGDDATGDLQGINSLIDEPETASLARTAKRKVIAGRSGVKRRAVRASDEDDNDEDLGQDFVEDEVSQEARLRQVRANLKALASVR